MLWEFRGDSRGLRRTDPRVPSPPSPLVQAATWRRAGLLRLQGAEGCPWGRGVSGEAARGVWADRAAVCETGGPPAASTVGRSPSPRASALKTCWLLLSFRYPMFCYCFFKNFSWVSFYVRKIGVMILSHFIIVRSRWENHSALCTKCVLSGERYTVLSLLL